MVAYELAVNIHDHGTALDDHKKRVKCIHCGKVVSGFSRLKCHLGGIRGNVVPCAEVPENIKDAMRNKLLEKKKGNLSNEVGELCHPNLSLKRNWCPQSNGTKDGNLEKIQHGESGCKKRVKVNSMSDHGATEVISSSNGKINSRVTASTREDSSPLLAQKCIGRFFYESGIDFSAAGSPGFQRMINAIHRSDVQFEFRIPSYQELRGRVLQDEVKEMQDYVKEVRNSWANTGCSILLDGWIDGEGRNLMNIIVDCQRGAIYLRSLDISAALGNVNSLQLLFEEVIEEVGAENVVQIVTYCASTCMEIVGKQLMDKYRNLFWTVSASHCLELMLEKMGMLDLIRGILEKAKTITKFIYSRATVLKLMRNYTQNQDLVKPSKLSSAMPFLSLENIVSEENNLREMFNSSEWSSSIWASSMEGRRVADLVADHSFWAGAMVVVKATIPIVRVMFLINEGDKPQLGFIYETVDQAKETIKEEFKNKRSQYLPFWTIIDDIWNHKLYSPLHSAGYFLNPSLFYSSDFYADAEVATGLLCCIVRMVGGKHFQDLVSIQVNEYRAATGSFGEGSAPNRRSSISPDLWWSDYGGQCPELQRLAIRVLSQTCDGASKYHLKRSLAEKLLTKGRNCIEQCRLNDLAFVHYNLQLQNFEPIGGTTDEEINPLSDWIVDDKAREMNLQSCEPSWMELLDCGDQTATASTTGKGLNARDRSSRILPKEEPEPMPNGKLGEI